MAVIGAVYCFGMVLSFRSTSRTQHVITPFVSWSDKIIYLLARQFLPLHLAAELLGERVGLVDQHLVIEGLHAFATDFEIDAGQNLTSALVHVRRKPGRTTLILK